MQCLDGSIMVRYAYALSKGVFELLDNEQTCNDEVHADESDSRQLTDFSATNFMTRNKFTLAYPH